MAEARAKIKAVLFDFGGVLAEEGFRGGLVALARQQQLDPAMVSRSGHELVHETGYVTGQGSEAEFWNRMRERTGLKGSDRELSAVILGCFVLRPALMVFARALRQKGFLTAILSDQTDWLERLDQRDGFFREFDRVFNSYRRGKTKRDSSIFDEVAAELGISPAEALFIDDTPGHVARAKSRGMRGIVFENEAQFLRQARDILGV